MVRAWYIEGEAETNPRDEHQRLPPKFITLEDLHLLTGVEHHYLNTDTYDSDGSLEKFKTDREYTYEDENETPTESDLQEFYQEHLHEEDEIRFVVEGCGYYDIRDPNDEWIRVEIVPGDLIIIPSGCYHRFTLDHQNIFTVKRIFVRGPIYKTYKKPSADSLECHQRYLQKMAERLNP